MGEVVMCVVLNRGVESRVNHENSNIIRQFCKYERIRLGTTKLEVQRI
jgi:hypothetical protein